ncbi:MAG: 50S ribosomal protein L21 [Rickettsiales bacterium]|jgi:large subunit ribosomal protein L21|nr:50S ribosomal protein L21 [Rickettsiales bacterium]
MFVVLETGGKQYGVSEGNTIKVEKLGANEGDTVTLSDVLFLQKDDGEILVGKPSLGNVKVEAVVMRNYRDDKILVFKKRRRKNSRRKNGHRQSKTELKISGIIVS